jgi:hypothetical protein
MGPEVTALCATSPWQTVVVDPKPLAFLDCEIVADERAVARVTGDRAGQRGVQETRRALRGRVERQPA